MKKDFEDIIQKEALDFTVTRVIAVSADNIGPNKLSVHFLAFKADCDWAVDGNGFADSRLQQRKNIRQVYG